MAADNWYRNKVWDTEIEKNFEYRLKDSIGTFNQAQYVRIQATYLLESEEKTTQLGGVNLMERLLKEFPEEEFSFIFAHEQLGDYYLSTGEFQKAEKHFRVVADYYENKKSSIGTSANVDLKIAEIFLTENKTEKLEDAYRICKNYPLTEVAFNNDKFYYAELLAQICSKMHNTEEAKEFAKAAIEIYRTKEPNYIRFKSAGFPKATVSQLRILEQIVNE
ncbi:MAG: hypothetical protein H0V30_04250 [Chitinophagaceae bacterium]|jgi:tetratricopeptide (TPR) repeat protein|nr:hypothetical protein [Chitinophagaceae bacterium]